MKTKLVFFSLLFSILSFGQNQSITAVQPFITPVPVTVPSTAAPNEIFRFQSGNVTQLDNGTGFNFTNSRWFSMGRVVTGVNTAYGLRFQLPNKALTIGYQSITNLNPRIEWIGTGVDLGNLEFRVANSFLSTTSTLVATMKSDGQTTFGTSSTPFNSNAKVRVLNEVSASIASSTGLNIDNSGSLNSNGIVAIARNGSQSNYGVLGITLGTAPFEAGIYGATNASNTNQWAGYFDGDVFCVNGTYQGSDAKLKDNIKSESSVLEKLSLLNPVTYNYKKIKELNLQTGIQHGFIAQELEGVFPELTRNVSKPIFNNEREFISTFNFKSVNYTGLISVLTAGINELNDELQLLKQEISELKAEARSNPSGFTSGHNDFTLEQNIPNPFTDKSLINYCFSTGVNKGNIMIFDLSGKLIKDFPVNENKGQLTITASQIGKGLFIYSLVQNGQELISKKMIIN